MNAPPFPLNPSMGQWFQNWVWNGARWVCSRSSGVRVIRTVFTASGPYQPSPGLVTVDVECIGGGGGGGAAQGQAATGVWAGGGGGSGGYSRIAVAAALVAGGVNVTIGDGGEGGTWTGTSAPAGSGQATSFGAFCVANGGSGGVGAGLGGGGEPGAGGLPGVGDIAWRGPSGGGGIIQVLASTLEYEAVGGIGGVIFGGNIAATAGTGAEAAGIDADPNSGAGGGGGIINQMGGAATSGGAGGDGVCICTEYCWADAASDGEDCVDPRTVNVNARVAIAHDEWGGGHRPGKPGWRPHGAEAFDDYGPETDGT